MEPKVIKSGNATLRIHSSLAHMSKEEQREWFQTEYKKGNPVVQNIAHTTLKLSKGIRNKRGN